MVADLVCGALPTCWSESTANAEHEAGKRTDAILDRGDDEGQLFMGADKSGNRGATGPTEQQA